MTESVSRNSPGPNRYPDAAEPESGTRGVALTGAEAMCRVEAQTVCSQDPSESAQEANPLLAKYQAAELSAFLRTQRSAGALPIPTCNSAERSAAHALEGMEAAFGTTSDQQSFYAQAAGVKGSRDGASFDVLSGAIQAGIQNEGQATLARVSLSSGLAAVEIRTLTAEVHGGVHNPDGSIGSNAGYSLNTIAVEATLTHSGNSVTFGLAAGPSAEASVGTRDADGDGNEELCVRVATGIVLGGACVETERLLEVSRRLYAELSTTPADWMGN